MTANATDGTGYGNFVTAHTVSREGYTDWTQTRRLKMRIMTGWPEGGFFRNSVWAPPFSQGHFELRSYAPTPMRARYTATPGSETIPKPPTATCSPGPDTPFNA